ncbi:MAG: HNH endonuclease [Smithella sp.]|jgi:hypothetical protein
MINRICKFCGKEFKIYPYRATDKNRGKFCSKHCCNLGQNHLPNSGQFKKGHIPTHGFKKGMISWNKGKKLPNRSRENHPNWKGGQYIRNGYVHCISPLHPHSKKDGYVLRSHLIMEKIIGRYIKPEEVVHHINKITTDDRPENLQLFPSKSEHKKYHLYYAP